MRLKRTEGEGELGGGEGGREGGEKEAIQGNLSPGSSLSCYVTSHRRAKERGGGFRDIVILQIPLLSIPLGVRCRMGTGRGGTGL